MKQIIITLLLVTSFSFVANAQFEIENLFLSGNFGFAKPIGDFAKKAKGGLTYTGEVGYFINDNIAVGLGYTGTATLSIGESLSDSYLFGLPSYFVKGWYHFSSGNFKPFVGLGLGVAQSGFPDVTIIDRTGKETKIDGEKRTGFGANAELGFVFKGFQLSYAFNMNGKTPKDFKGAPSASDLTVNYHRFNIGYRYRLNF